MRAGMDCLLDCLRAGGDLGQYTFEDWADALKLAEEEQVLPFVAAQLSGGREVAPAGVAAQVDAIACEEAKAAFFWCAELRGVLRAFAERGIPVVPLKGPSLAERIYNGAALRPNRDLDLLVATQDWASAENALTAIGFAPLREADDYHRPWMRQTTKLELHFDVENPLAFNFHVASALTRATPAEFMGEPCRLLAPEDELLYLCLHAARHRYERLGLVLDLRFAFERLPAGDWQSRPEVAGLDNLLVLGLLMARRLNPGLKDGWNPGAADREWRHLETVANGLWLRLRTEPFQRRDWNMAHSFYLDLEPTRWRRLKRRLRHARIFATRIIDRDRTFAVRFGMTRNWQVRMMRPLRLLNDRRGRN
jgi:hypothetical protein